MGHSYLEHLVDRLPRLPVGRSHSDRSRRAVLDIGGIPFPGWIEAAVAQTALGETGAWPGRGGGFGARKQLTRLISHPVDQQKHFLIFLLQDVPKRWPGKPRLTSEVVYLYTRCQPGLES